MISTNSSSDTPFSPACANVNTSWLHMRESDGYGDGYGDGESDGESDDDN